MSQVETTPTKTNNSIINILIEMPVTFRLTFLFLFFFFFYRIIYDIGIFFEFNDLELILYMTWFGILILLLSFLRIKRTELYKK